MDGQRRGLHPAGDQVVVTAKKLVNVRVDPSEKERWVAAAEQEGVTLTEYVCSAVRERMQQETPVSGQDSWATTGLSVPASPLVSVATMQTDGSPIVSSNMDALPPEIPPTGGSGRTRPCVHRVPVGQRCRWGCD